MEKQQVYTERTASSKDQQELLIHDRGIASPRPSQHNLFSYFMKPRKANPNC